jgi:dihydrofolate synthase/folylpolyglutamate synthase
MAFVYFKDQKVDIAIIETGLGGRLDSTNVITPELAIITNIGLDHTQFLGNDLLSIAKEKGGIIKENTPVVIGQVNDDIRDLYNRISSEKNAAILFSDDLHLEPIKTDLLGSYQVFNLRTVLASIRVMRQRNWKISDQAIKLGLESVKKNTGLSGRWDVIQENPKVICDTGHNKEGLTEVLEQLQKETFEELHIVMGMVNDKDPAPVLSLFPPKAKYYFCQASVPRSLNVNELLNTAIGIGLHGKAFNSVPEAYSAAIHDATPKDLVFVGGSTFVVADFLNYLEMNRSI